MNAQLRNIFRFNKVFWWIITFILILNLGFFATIGRSQKKRISDLQNEYRVKRQAQQPQKDPKQEKFLLAKQDIKKFREGLPLKMKFTDVASEIFNILRKHRLSATKIIYKPEPMEAQRMVKYSTSFTISGEYQDLKTFLADMQESTTLFCIESLSFSDRLGEEETVDLKLRISTYFK